jgi:glycosyltransferase involved in cell wall biosynthesis
MNLSVVLITRNEAGRLGGALESVAGLADEVLVCDSLSTDGTAEVAGRHGCRVIRRAFDGFARQRNHAAGEARGGWILALDADERLSPELREEIRALRTGEPACAAFSMPRRSLYLGRWIRHSGWYPDRKVRLHRRDRARWSGEHVHERLVVEGEVRRLRGDILHLGYADLEDHLRRVPRYALLAARERHERGERFRLSRLVLAPPARALRSYVLRAGVLDGFPGLMIAALTAYGAFLRQAFLWEMDRVAARRSPPPR